MAMNNLFSFATLCTYIFRSVHLLISIDFTSLYNHSDLIVKLELKSSYKNERKQLKYFKNEK